MMINEEYAKKLQGLYKEHKILLDDLSIDELNALIKLYTKQNSAIDKRLNSKR